MYERQPLSSCLTTEERHETTAGASKTSIGRFEGMCANGKSKRVFLTEVFGRDAKDTDGDSERCLAGWGCNTIEELDTLAVRHSSSSRAKLYPCTDSRSLSRSFPFLFGTICVDQKSCIIFSVSVPKRQQHLVVTCHKNLTGEILHLRRSLLQLSNLVRVPISTPSG
jgi:hypothetical protein